MATEHQLSYTAKEIDEKLGKIEIIPDYWQSELGEKVLVIRQAIEKAGRNKSAFLWYSDIHWNMNHKQSPKLLKYLYNNTPINKTIFGGDALQDEPSDDTVNDTVEMSYVYNWRAAIRSLPNHHSVVGNHDVSYGGFTDEIIYSYLFAPEENNNVVYGDNFYYYIDDNSEKTRYLYLDTAYKINDDAQAQFLVDALLSTPNGWHIVAIAHIWHDALWTEELGDYIGDYSSIANKILAVFYAYNHRGIGIVNFNSVNIDYDFTNCGGKVEFCIGGHIHWDYTSYYNDEILVILTETDSTRERINVTAKEGTITENSVNAIVADYNNNQVSIIRIGRGESRIEKLKSATPVTYTNVISDAIDAEGNTYNGCGYAINKRYSNSGGGFINADGVYCTGFIAVEYGDVVRLKNVTMNTNSTASNVCHMLTFDSSFIYSATSDGANLIKYSSAVTDDEGNITQFTINEYISYIVLNTSYIGADSVITINEEIE